jgi:hypothetical protein
MEYPELKAAGEVNQVCVHLENSVKKWWKHEGIIPQQLLRSWALSIRSQWNADNLTLTTRSDEYPAVQPIVDLLVPLHAQVAALTSQCARVETLVHTVSASLCNRLAAHVPSSSADRGVVAKVASPSTSMWEYMGIVTCCCWNESQKTSTLTALLTLEQDTNIIECFSGPGQWHANEACFNAIPDWKCVHAKLEKLCMHTGLSLSLCVWSGLSLSDTSSFRFLLHLPRMLNSLHPVRLNLRPHALADTCVC